MNENIISFLKDTRLRIILVLAIAVAAIAYILGFKELALGVLAATPLASLNYWMMWDTIQRKTEDKALMGRSLIRMILSIVALLLAVQVGIQFLLGVMLGLVLHVFTYIHDVADVISGKKFK